jgi:hypothetical protein
MSNVIDRGRNPLFGRVCFFQIATQSLSLTFAAGLVTLHHSLAAVDGCALSKEPMDVVASWRPPPWQSNRWGDNIDSTYDMSCPSYSAAHGYELLQDLLSQQIQNNSRLAAHC